MNKNQKFIAKMNINHYGNEEIKLRQPGSTSIKTLSPIYSMKLSSINQIIVVLTPVQQAELVNNLIWRQKTSMPVVKILSFRNESCDYGYPKTYTVQVQSIAKSISNLSNIELSQSLYLIQQCLQGVQALTYKYSSFDFHRLFFGLNDRGQCRTWVSGNLLDYKAVQLPLPSQDIMICHVAKMVQSSCSNICKMQLQQFIKQIANIPNLNFTQMNVRLSQFARLKGIIVPNHALIANRTSQLVQTKSDIIQRYPDFKDKKLLDHHLNFRYQSPTSKNYYFRQNQEQLCRKSCIQIPAAISFSDSVRIQNSKIKHSDQRHASAQKQKHHFGIRFPLNQKTNSVQNMLMSSQSLKNKLKMSKDSFKDSMCKISSNKNSYLNTHQFVMSEQKMKTCTSLTFPTEKTIISESLIKQEEIYKQKQTKKSESTTHMSDQNNNFFNINIKEPFDRLMKRSQNQNNNPDGAILYRESSKNNYNFGGLIPCSQKTMKQSQQVDQKFIQLTDIRNRNRISSIQRRNEHFLESRVMNQSGWRDKSIIQFDWDVRVVRLFTQDNNNLKQSVYCGEEKKPQPLPIKLDLLGRFGRQITSGSIIPEPHQF